MTHEDRQEAEEEAQAALLMQELMCGTPRGGRPNMNAPARPPQAPPPQQQQHDAEEEEGEEEEEDDDDPRYSAEPQCLLARRRLKGMDSWSYLVRWKGLDESWDCWVDAEHLDADFVRSELEETESDRPQLTARAHAEKASAAAARARARATEAAASEE